MRKELVACMTLDLEPDYAGRVPLSYESWRRDTIDRLRELFGERRIPLSIFVTGKAIEDQPLLVNRCRGVETSFFLHSYNHRFDRQDSTRDLDRGISVFKKHFKRFPLGYRAPEGRVGRQLWELLAGRGFSFDASIFPSFWPTPAYFFLPQKPFRPIRGFVEVPFSVITPFHIPVVLSWMKLLGWGVYARWFAHIQPTPLVVGFHLHDIVHPIGPYRRLPWWLRLVYMRHRNDGMNILTRCIASLAGHGYRFVSIGELLKLAS